MKKWAVLAVALGVTVAGAAHADYDPSYWHSNQKTQMTTDSSSQPGDSSKGTLPAPNESSPANPSGTLPTPNESSPANPSGVLPTPNGGSPANPSDSSGTLPMPPEEIAPPADMEPVNVTQIYPLNTDTAVMQIFYDQLSPTSKQQWAELPPQWREVAVQLAQEDLDHGSFYNIDDPDQYVQKATLQYEATQIQPEM